MKICHWFGPVGVALCMFLGGCSSDDPPGAPAGGTAGVANLAAGAAGSSNASGGGSTAGTPTSGGNAGNFAVAGNSNVAGAAPSSGGASSFAGSSASAGASVENGGSGFGGDGNAQGGSAGDDAAGASGTGGALAAAGSNSQGGLTAGGGATGISGATGIGGSAGASSLVSAHLVLTLLTAPGNPVAGVDVHLGAQVATSNVAGKVMFDLSATGTEIVRISSPAFAAVALELPLATTQDLEHDVWLVRRRPAIVFRAEHGISRRETDVMISIPPSAIVDSQGKIVTGPVSVRLAPINGTQEALRAAPGPFLARVAGSDAMLDSFGMLEVTLWRGTEPLNLAPGSVARVALPVPEHRRGDAPAGTKLPSWYLDIATARWLPTGDGTITVDPADSSRLWWVADVSHFSWVNSDRVVAYAGQFGCLNVKAVADDTGEPLSALFTFEASVGYRGIGVTGGSGEACVRVPSNSLMRIRGGGPGLLMVESTTVVSGDTTPSCNATCAAVTIRLKRVQCLAGVVEHASGSPVADAAVIGRWSNAAGTGLSVTLTHSDGSYCLNAPMQTTVSLQAYADGLQTDMQAIETLGTPGSCSNLAACLFEFDPIACVSGGICTAAAPLILDEACLKGRVVNESGGAIAGAKITANYSHAGVERQGASESDASGNFCVTVPRGVLAMLSAQIDNGTQTDYSVDYAVQTDNATQSCRAGDCTPSPDLVIHTPACIRGQVQGPGGEPIEGATVTGTLDSTYGFQEITADTDAAGAYCLQVPPSASVVLHATTEVSGLPVDSSEAITSARSTPATCGSSNCAVAGILQFAMLQCVNGRVLDELGRPWADATVTITRERMGAYPSPDPLVVHTDLDGSYCGTVYPRSWAEIKAVRTSAGRPISDSTSLAIPLGGAVCGGAACAAADDLILPRSSCVNGSVYQPTGASAEGTGVAFAGHPELPVFGLDASSPVNYCVDLPQGQALSLAVNSGIASDYQTLAPVNGREISCATGGCAARPDSHLALPTCLSGVVVDSTGAAVAGAEVSAHYFDAYQRRWFSKMETIASVTTGTTGDYCLDVPANAELNLVAESFTPARLAATATLHTSTAAATCGGSGTCVAQAPLALGNVTTCVRGVAVERGTNSLSQPFAAGTPVFVYGESNMSLAASCGSGNDNPSNWGPMLAQSTVGANGSFCVEFLGMPSTTTTPPSKVQIQIGDCTSIAPACIGTAKVDAGPVVKLGTCPSGCLDIGVVRVEGAPSRCGIAS